MDPQITAIVIGRIDTPLDLEDLMGFVHQPCLVDGLFEAFEIFLVEPFPLPRMIHRCQHNVFHVGQMSPRAFRDARGFFDAIAVDHGRTTAHKTRQIFGTQPWSGQSIEQYGLFAFVPMPRIVATSLQVEMAGILSDRQFGFAATLRA